MGFTHFPHGITSMGAPVVGAGRLTDLFNSENIFFVDGDLSGSSSSQDGLTPATAVSKPSEAVSKATRGAMIYVRPRTTTASAQTYYVDNITIPKTKPGISIVGCGNVTGASAGVQLKPSTVTDHLITVNGAGALFENMRLTLTGGTADVDKCIINAVRDVAATRVVADLTVRYCRLENDKSHPSYSGTNAVGAIGLGSANYVVIEYNTFSQCLGSIVSQETNGVTRDLTIRGNIFGGLPANRDVDIWLSLGASYNINICNNLFADGLPAHSGGSVGRFIKIEGATAVGLVSGNSFATTTDSFTSAGSQAVIPDTFFVARNYFNNGLCTGA